MEDQDKNIPQLENEQSQKTGSGAILAAARKEANKTAEEVAEELNLSASQISAIELDQKDELPEPTYVRGYIRAYAKLLDLDPDEVLLSYKNQDWDKGSKLGDIPVGIEVKESHQSKLFNARNLLLLGLLIAAFIYWFEFRESEPNVSSTVRTRPDTQLASGSSAETPTDTSNEVSTTAGEAEPAQTDDGEEKSGVENENIETGDETDTLAIEPAENLNEANEDAGVESDLDEGSSEDLEPETESAQVATDVVENEDTESNESAIEESELTEGEGIAINNLVIEFIETSWIDIRDSEEQRIAYRSYARGERLEVNQAGSLKVLIGNAEGVSVRLNGEPYNLAPHINGPYAEFVVE